jgi:hypothetical protein
MTGFFILEALFSLYGQCSSPGGINHQPFGSLGDPWFKPLHPHAPALAPTFLASVGMVASVTKVSNLVAVFFINMLLSL